MKLFFVLAVLLSFLGRAFSDETAPAVSTLYSGTVSPVGIWSDANGNIFGCETGFHSVFKITSGGVKTNFAGTHGTAGVASEGVFAVNALFNSPRGVWGDGQFLYITDSANNRIRRVSWTTSLVTTVVGGGTGSILTSGEFLGTSVALSLPNAIAGSSNGKVYFADFGHVYLLTPETGLVGMVSFVAGGGDHIGTFAHGAQVSLKDIQGLAVDPTNNNVLFVADSGNKVVRKMNLATGKSIIFAGKVKKNNFVIPSKPFENGETAYKVTFGNPLSVWVGGDGSVFIADSLYHTISVVRHDKIYLFAGKWSYGSISNTLMTGPANQVQIEASHIFGDSSRGVLYLCDGTRGGIQLINPLTVNVYAPTATPTAPPTKNPTVFPTGQPTSRPTTKPIVHYDSTYTIGVGSSELTDNDKNTICQTILETTVPKPDSCTIIAANFAPIIVDRRRLKQVKPLDGGYNVDVTARLDYDLVNNPTFTVEQLTEAVTAALDQAVQDNSFSDALTTNAATNNAVQLQAATVAEVKTVTSSVTNEQSPSAAIPIVSKTKMGSAVTGPNTPFPGGFWADKNGNTFFSDTFKISKQSSTGDVTLFAGSGPGAGGDGGSAIDATIFAPTGFWGDSDNLYFIDQLFPTMKRIRAINFSTNKITLVVGGGQTPADTTPRLATEVTIGFAQSLWGDGRGNIYIANENQVLHFSLDTNLIQQIAYSTDGQLRGEDGSKVPFLSLEAPKALGFQQPSGLGQLAGDATRNCLYITEMVNYESRNSAIIRKFDLTTSTATIFAGQYGQRDTTKYTNGALATSIKFSAPTGLWVADDGTVFMSDPESFTISAINPDSGKVYWFAGTWNNGGQSGIYDYNDFVNVLGMDDLAREGKIVPFQLTGSSAANALYVIDKEHQAVRKITEVLSATGVKPPARRLLALKPPSKFNLRGSGSF
jgi:sugar lactone lactonase YvrE